MDMIFYYDKKLGGRFVVHKYFSNFFWHGANFRILAQHHRKRRKPKFHRSLIPGSRLILINPVTFVMTRALQIIPIQIDFIPLNIPIKTEVLFRLI